MKHRRNEFCLRQLKVGDASVRITAAQGDDAPRVSIVVSGALDARIGSATSAELNVWEVADSAALGAALGISSGLLRLQVGLMRQEFLALVTVVAAGRLSQIQMLLDPIVRGKGKFRSIAFSTSPID